MVFKFKKFEVNQAQCTMKVNTDGVLLGALATADPANDILDVGTGTGVIALMLAQRFGQAAIDAIEIDTESAQTAIKNFENSVFYNRIQGYSNSFQEFFKAKPEKKYDLIVSNPPFFINALESVSLSKKLSRHTNENFFENFLQQTAAHLAPTGALWLILPLATENLTQSIGLSYHLAVQKRISIHSFPHVKPHRVIVKMGFQQMDLIFDKLVIYEQEKQYTKTYQGLLRDFLTIF